MGHSRRPHLRARLPSHLLRPRSPEQGRCRKLRAPQAGVSQPRCPWKEAGQGGRAAGALRAPHGRGPSPGLPASPASPAARSPAAPAPAALRPRSGSSRCGRKDRHPRRQGEQKDEIRKRNKRRKCSEH